MWTDGGILSRPTEEGRAGSDTKNLQSLMSIWSTDWINSSLKSKDSAFGFLRILDLSPGQLHNQVKSHPVVQLLGKSDDVRNDEPPHTRNLVDSKLPLLHGLPGGLPSPRSIAKAAWTESFHSRPEARFAIEAAVAPIIRGSCADRTFEEVSQRSTSDELLERTLYGLSPSQRNEPVAAAALQDILPGAPPAGLIASSPHDQLPISSMRVPPIKRLVVDSAKLARLDSLLKELKAGGHRVLVYFQMTRMMDLVEEYLIYRQYKYLRLDGASAIGDRRDMVTSWQTKSVYLLALS
jgi:DNA helicase INO80